MVLLYSFRETGKSIIKTSTNHSSRKKGLREKHGLIRIRVSTARRMDSNSASEAGNDSSKRFPNFEECKVCMCILGFRCGTRILGP